MATVSRESLAKIGTVQIPRPKCQGFQFINTRGRMGFYRSIKRDGEKYGIQMKNMGPRRPQLPDATFWNPKMDEEEPANNNNNKVEFDNKHASPAPAPAPAAAEKLPQPRAHHQYEQSTLMSPARSKTESNGASKHLHHQQQHQKQQELQHLQHQQQQQSFIRSFEKHQASTMNRQKMPGNAPAKLPPPAPPLPDSARLPPRPPRVTTLKKKNDPAEPPIDYNSNDDARSQFFRRQAPVMHRHRTILEEAENEHPGDSRKATRTPSHSSSDYSERF